MTPFLPEGLQPEGFAGALAGAGIAGQLGPGGWAVLGVLALLSVAALSVALFKAAQFLRLGVGRHRRAEDALDLWLSGQGDAALALADARATVTLRVLFAALSALRAAPEDRAYARELATQTALDELATMERRLRFLDGVVQAAPMLGLLGTVIGMIEAFGQLAADVGAIDPGALAGGIWTALLTTAVGLAVAIPFYFAALWLEGRVTRERAALERLISAALHGRVETRAPRRWR